MIFEFAVKRIVPDQSFDDVTTDEDRDENELYTYNAGQLRRTISSYSNNTHTVAVDVHTGPGQHLANPPYSEESQNMTPVLRSKQAKRSSGQKKRIQTNATEMEISQQPRDINGGYARKESESNGVIYHELPSETTNADTDSNLRQKHSTEEKVKVRTKTKRKIIVSQSMKTKQPTKDNATFNSPAKLSKENSEATNIEKDQKTDVCVQARESPICADLNRDVYSVEKSKDPRKLDKDQRVDDNRSELNSNSVATVARSYSTISQRSSSQSNVMENSMTSIDVNKMSIPILNDDYTITNSNPNTPRSARESTPRFDPDPNNSLPRVIKVRKNKSMAQAKRNIRRSIKRSRQRAQTSGMYILFYVSLNMQCFNENSIKIKKYVFVDLEEGSLRGGGGCKVAANLICLANKIVLGPFLKYADDYWPRQANNRNIKKFFDFYFTESHWTSASFLYILIENT